MVRGSHKPFFWGSGPHGATNQILMKQFNCYGRLTPFVMFPFMEGDLVEFSYQKSFKTGNRVINKTITIQGIWDGKKVEFPDKEQTIVRTTQWLKFISRNCLV